MVDIEVKMARVYFSIGNRAKMRVGGFGVAKYGFWGQKDIVLAIIFFFKFYKYPKMMSFWTMRVQNSVVLNQLSLIQNDVIWISDNLSKTTTLTPKRCRFLSYRDQTTSFWPRVAEKKNPCSYIPDVGQKNEKNEESCLYAWLMHTNMYGSVKGDINFRIMKDNDTRRKNVKSD